MTSTSFIWGTGLKKCRPMNRFRRSSDTAWAMSPILSEDVFEAKMVSAGESGSNEEKSDCLAERFSRIASTMSEEDEAFSSDVVVLTLDSVDSMSWFWSLCESGCAFLATRALRCAPDQDIVQMGEWNDVQALLDDLDPVVTLFLAHVQQSDLDALLRRHLCNARPHQARAADGERVERRLALRRGGEASGRGEAGRTRQRARDGGTKGGHGDCDAEIPVWRMDSRSSWSKARPSEDEDQRRGRRSLPVRESRSSDLVS